MRKCRLLIFILLVAFMGKSSFIATCALASSIPEKFSDPLLEDPARFKEIASAWSVDLSGTGPYSTVAVSDAEFKQSFNDIIYNGFKRLRIINPDLADELLARVENKPLRIIFHPRTRDFAGQLIYSCYPGKFGCRLHDLFTPEMLLTWDIVSGWADSLSMKYPVGKYVSNAIFHEFLHFSDLDIPATHNHAYAHLWDHTDELDLVFACAAQAYSNESTPLIYSTGEVISERQALNGGLIERAYTNTHLACLACATATLQNHLFSRSFVSQIDTADSRALEVCSDVKDSDFLVN